MPIVLWQRGVARLVVICFIMLKLILLIIKALLIPTRKAVIRVNINALLSLARTIGAAKKGAVLIPDIIASRKIETGLFKKAGLVFSFHQTLNL